MSKQYKPKNVDSQEPQDSSHPHEEQATRQAPRRNDHYQGPRNRGPRYDDRDNRRQGQGHREKYPRDETKITYYSTLPEVPAVKKIKPNEENFRAKVKELEDALSAAKAERKAEKEAITKATIPFTTKVEELNRQIQLGRDILKILDQDEIRADQDVRKFRSLIFDFERRKNRPEPRQQNRGQKKNEEMNAEQIDAEIDRLRQKLINEDLSKKATAETHNAIEKLKILKVNAVSSAPVQAQTPHDKSDEEIERKIAQYNEDLNKQLRRKVEAKVKIDLVTDEISTLQNEKLKVIKDKENVENGPEYARARELKEKIRSLRSDLQDLDSKYHAALDAWTEEQAFLQYVEWATEVKKRKIEENERLKEERRRQKGKEARRNDKEKDNKDNQEGEERERVRPPPPHPYAKEIENIRFLSNYVERLKPETKTETTTGEPVAKKTDLKSELTKGVWTKEKGIEVIVSKKDRDIDTPITNSKKEKKEKTLQKIDLPSGQFDHSIQVVRLFDAIKVLPPKTEQELDTVLGQLEEKRQYFLSAKPEERPQQPGSTTGKPYRRRDEEPQRDSRPVQNNNTQKKPNISLGDFPEL